MAQNSNESTLRNLDLYFTSQTTAEDLAERIHRVMHETLRVLPEVEDYRRDELLNNLDYLETFRTYLLGTAKECREAAGK